MSISTYFDKVKFAKTYYKDKLALIKSVSRASNERSNFTYQLSDLNMAYMTSILNVITGESIATINRYVEELLQHEQLRQHYRERVIAVGDKEADLEPRFCRRLSWYVMARVKKPALLMETGVDKGLGALVLAAAVEKNREDGHDGRYIGLEINPKGGYLFDGHWTQFGEIIYDDSLKTIDAFNDTVDFFIHDSDHDPAFEMKEYRLVQNKLTPDAILISDNAHVSDALWRFSQEIGKRFLPWEEKPVGHWYPGCITGYAF